MTADEYRALVEAGPAVVMVAKEDMLKLLDRVIISEKEFANMRRLLERLTISEQKLTEESRRIHMMLGQ